jgi:hypothetical protein
MALRGMPSYSVDWGVCAITMPPSPFTALTPRAPSLPLPESTMQMARSRWSWAKDRKKKSMGSRMPRANVDSNSCNAPFTSAMSRLGGMI